jgi:hypothetical protein
MSPFYKHLEFRKKFYEHKICAINHESIYKGWDIGKGTYCGIFIIVFGKTGIWTQSFVLT